MVRGRQFEAALKIVETLRARGHEAYFAGGCVRDLLLRREPADYDVATSATPEVVLEMFPRTFAVGAHFGVVLVAPEAGDAGFVTEVATFRSDLKYSDGRHPDGVRYTKTAEEDVRRRDFTINGLLLDPLRLIPRSSGAEAGPSCEKATTGPSTPVAAATFAQDDNQHSSLRMTAFFPIHRFSGLSAGGKTRPVPGRRAA
jgi:hypothetical protein